ncbi:hypothetical protein [Nocardioides ferulae]|uniref:hypothetical protein n=1 Tax=Nocardioides ferulae TaxID=2340821 RepID=UPI000EB5696D|nr:hypothetical protein [Nocardioides ferulae]
MSRTATRAAAIALCLGLSGGLAGCSGDDEPGEVPEAADPWNPCDGLSAREVSGVLGQQLRKDTGAGTENTESTEPGVVRCALLPVREGDATFDASYLLFDGGLDAAWATLGDGPDGSVGGRVTRPSVPGADAARLVVNTTRKAALVTGFVENGDLIQTVNAVDLYPYDAGALVRATRLVLEQLSAHAADAGVE